MKKTVVLLSLFVFFLSCSKEQTAQTGESSALEVKQMTREQVNNCIEVLPVVLNFQELIADALPDSGTEEYFDAYIGRIKKNETLVSRITNAGFSDVDEFWDVYLNLIFCYDTLQNYFEDFETEIAQMESELEYQRSQISILTMAEGINVEQKALVREQMEELDAKEIFYKNLHLVFDAMDELNALSEESEN